MSGQQPSESEGDDLYEINTDFIGDLLRDGGEEALAELVNMYSSSLSSPPEFHDAPELELDYNQLDLEEDDSDREGTYYGPTDTREPEQAEQAATDETGVSEGQGEPLPWQPGLKRRERKIEIWNIGVFWRHNGQPIRLRAYPYVRPDPVSVVRG